QYTPRHRPSWFSVTCIDFTSTSFDSGSALVELPFPSAQVLPDLLKDLQRLLLGRRRLQHLAHLSCTALRGSIGRSVTSAAASRGLRPPSSPAAAFLTRLTGRSVPPLMVAHPR